MRYQVWFGERQSIETIWVPTGLSPADIELNAARLRGWALVRGAKVSGSPFLSIPLDCETRVCLPLGGPLTPRTGCGISRETLAGGPIAVASDIPFQGLRGHVEELTRWLEQFATPRAPAEYQWRFNGSGLLTLPLASLPAEVTVRPRNGPDTAFTTRDPAAPGAELVAEPSRRPPLSAPFRL